MTAARKLDLGVPLCAWGSSRIFYSHCIRFCNISRQQLTALGKSLGPRGGVFSNTSLLSAVYGYNMEPSETKNAIWNPWNPNMQFGTPTTNVKYPCKIQYGTHANKWNPFDLNIKLMNLICRDYLLEFLDNILAALKH